MQIICLGLDFLFIFFHDSLDVLDESCYLNMVILERIHCVRVKAFI